MSELWNDVDRYLVASTVGDDAMLDEVLARSDRAGLPPINVAPNQGKLLSLLARMAGARRILEIGTLGGYSTIWLARALPTGDAEARVISLELDPHHASVAHDNFALAGVAERVEVRVGPALDSLAELVREKLPPFDFVFIDADKANSPEYFARSIELSRAGATIVLDNVVRGGTILDAHGDEGARGMRRYFEMVARDRRVEATAVQTVGSKGHDGFALALVVGKGDSGGARSS